MEEQDTDATDTGTDSGIVMSPNYTTKLDGSIVDLTRNEDGTDLPAEEETVHEDDAEHMDIGLDECISMEGEVIEGDIEAEVIDEAVMTGEMIETEEVEGEVIGEVLEGEVIEEEIVEEPLTPATDVSGTTRSLTDSGRVTPISQSADPASYSSSEKGTPNRRGRSSDVSGRKVDYDSLSSSSGSVKGGNFPQRHGIHWRKGEKLEAMDYLNTWFPAKIRSINEEEMQVLIHFDGWNQRYDEWINMGSDRLRPLVRHSVRKEQRRTAKGVRGRRKSTKLAPIPLNMRLHHDFKIGDAVYAKWTDCKMYPAKITNIMPTGSYEVIFYDGFKKLVQPINIRPMPNEYKSFEIDPVPELVLKKAKMKLDCTDKPGSPDDRPKSQERARSESKGDSSSEKEGKIRKAKKRKLVGPELFGELGVVGLGEQASEVGGEIKSEQVSTQTEYAEHKTEDLSGAATEPGPSTASVLPAADTPAQTPLVGTLPPKAFVVESDHNQYKCPFEGCNKGFRKENLLDYHIKYYHISGGGPPPPPAKRRRKTTSTCSTESESVGGSRKSGGKKNRNLSAEGALFTVEGKLEYPDTPLSCGTETGEISTQTAVDIGEDSNQDLLKLDSQEESSVTDAEDYLKPDELVNCICDFQEENGLMIQCEVCMCWQHAACFGISENTLPKTYVCFVCENPPGVRESARYIHEQDWFKTGEIPSFSFLPVTPMTEEQCNTVKSTHTLVNEIHQLNAVLHSLKLQLKIIRTKDEGKLRQWRVDWDSIETETVETCPMDDSKPPEQEVDRKPLIENLGIKQEPAVSNGSDVKDENFGSKLNEVSDIKQEKSAETNVGKLSKDSDSSQEDEKPLDLSRNNSDGKDETTDLKEPLDLTTGDKSQTKDEANASDNVLGNNTMRGKPEKVEEDKVSEITMDLDTDTYMKAEDNKDIEKNGVKEVNGETGTVPDRDVNLGGPKRTQSGEPDVVEEKPDIKIDIKPPGSDPEEGNYSESTESVVEDSIEVCERNLLNYILKIQGEISDRFDKIEEQIEMLEAMEAMQSRRERPTTENVFSDMPQLKRSVRNMQEDLLKVKKMAVFH